MYIEEVKRSQNKLALRKNSSNFLRELNMQLTILKAVGLFPIVKQISDYEIEGPSHQNNIYSTIIRGIIHSLTIFNLYSMFQRHSVEGFSTERETDNINQYIEIIITITTYTGTIILCSRHSNDFLNILRDILKIDSSIEQRYQVKVQNHCKFAQITVLGIFAVQLFLISLKFTSGDFTSSIQYLFFLFYAFQNCICSMFMILLSALLQVVSQRFDFVNAILEKFSYNMIEMKIEQRLFEEDVTFVFRLHNRLLIIFKLLNESCSLMVALFMGYAFYSITTKTYNIFVEFTTYEVVSWVFLLDCFAWLAVNTTLLAILANICGQATRKANTLQQVVAKIYGRNKDSQTIIDKFLTKSIRQEVEFTAYGFFVVDNSTLFNIFSAVTTYLVILIQFKELEETKVETPTTIRVPIPSNRTTAQ
ncbi:gustatory and pheromone receptor 32a [Eupeodes corollae]|uniref:gustatory and pheromone receptor 32a n=1 Tax=Eupeodes corollae TaxID=290404 RepID=UPI00249262EA|nr:gustatory and pheromone receptor 32a [Eupeodes corollae]